MAKLRRHIREQHWTKSSYFACSECGWASLRRHDIRRHVDSSSHGFAVVRHIQVPEGFDHLEVCHSCNFVGLDLKRHVCGVVLNRYTGNAFVPPSTGRVVEEFVSANDPRIVAITPLAPSSPPRPRSVVDSLFEECFAIIEEFHAGYDNELGCDMPQVALV